MFYLIVIIKDLSMLKHLQFIPDFSIESKLSLSPYVG